MTTPTPAPTPDRDLASPVDRALASAMRDAGWSWGTVPDDVAAQHLAAITALATEHAHVAARPPSPTWRSRMRRVAGLTIVKVAVGAGVAAAATTGGLAAGGHLPDPVQGVVADGVGWIGIDLPRPDPRPDPAADADEVVEDAPRSTTTDEVPAGDTPDSGEVAEVVPDDAPPVTTPAPGPPDELPADTDDAPPDERPADAPPANTPPDREPPAPQPGGPAGDAPPTRETQGGADGAPDEPGADDPGAPPSATTPDGADEGQTQSGQVPTSSRR